MASDSLFSGLNRLRKMQEHGHPLVFRVIHTIHPAMKHLAQYRFTGESRCPRQKWILAFAGKARRGIC